MNRLLSPDVLVRARSYLPSLEIDWLLNEMACVERNDTRSGGSHELKGHGRVGQDKCPGLGNNTHQYDRLTHAKIADLIGKFHRAALADHSADGGAHFFELQSRSRESPGLRYYAGDGLHAEGTDLKQVAFIEGECEEVGIPADRPGDHAIVGGQHDHGLIRETVQR